MEYPIKHTRAHRVLLSNELAASLHDRYKSDLLATAYFGSMSRDEDKDYSDIDMIAVVKGQGVAGELEGIKDGLNYGIDIFSQDVIRNKITTVTMRWPLLVGKFVTAKPISDESHLFDEYLQLFNETVKGNFDPYIRQIFVQEIYEECNKFINTADNGTRAQVNYSAYHLVTKLMCFIGVINKSYYLSSVTMPEKALGLSFNFPSFQALCKNVISDEHLPTPQLRTLVQDLLSEIIRFLDGEGIIFED